MMSAQTSAGSLPWDMAEWDPGNEPRHRAKVRYGKMNNRNSQRLTPVQRKKPLC